MQTIAVKVGKGKKQQLVLIESTGRGNVPRNAARPVVEKAAVQLEQHIEPITALAEAIRHKLTELNNPGKIAIEFGVEIGVDVAVPLITAGSAKGNFKVTLEWENPPKHSSNEKGK